MRATFFVKGQNLRAQTGTARHVLAAGHQLANHTETHPAGLFWWLRPARLRHEIDACNAALREAGLPTTGKADEKRQRLAEALVPTVDAIPVEAVTTEAEEAN